MHARRRWRNARSGDGRAPDLVQRNFGPAGPDQLWAADVTQFRTGEGWLCLAAVIGLWSRRVIGNSATTELVTQALVMAATRRAPGRRAIHHSGRGAACTSLAFWQRITELELHQSLGKTGDCYGHPAVQAFSATLKRELAWIHHTKRWSTKDQLRTALFDYTEDFHNPQPIQHRPGHQSPIDFERAIS